jgi:mannose-6-phosphate isomerase-like protein (cupin superfamily)
MTLKTAATTLFCAITMLLPLHAQVKKGTYIPNEEIQAYLKRVEGVPVADQQVRAVDIGKSNVALGVVYRGKLTAPGPNTVAEHDKVSEVYHILDGTATLMVGADIVGLKPRPADDRAVRLLNGPGGNGSSIRNGVSYNLKAGDVVIIPAGVGHLYTRIDDHIRYIMVRIDPDKVAPLKDEAASQEELRTGANKSR